MAPSRALGPRPGWFRLYNRLPNDPKIFDLDDRTFRHWVLSMCIASQHYGKLPPIGEFAFYLRIDESEAARLIQTLLDKKLLDRIDGDLIPHNWSKHQYESDNSTPRVKRFRERRRNAAGNVAETAPDTEAYPNTETDSEQTRAADAALPRGRPDGWPEDFQDQFWKKYPHKVGKILTFKLLAKVRKDGAAWPDLLSGLDAYIRSKPKDREWCNPATWLSEGRWDDVPAKSKSNRSVSAAAADLRAEMERLSGRRLTDQPTEAREKTNLLEYKPS